jgi:hypothetical protein
MKSLRWAPILLAVVALNASPPDVNASPPDVNGAWKVRPGPKGAAFKTIGSITLNFREDGKRVTGTVQIGAWPGDAPILDGTIEGNTIAFTATGTRTSSTGIPTAKIVATVDGDAMDLVLSFIANVPPGAGGVWEYKGGRLPAGK